ncbi:MAG: hypothetical protein AAGG02_14675 [Cyanobacteria bacterium P01_H01_bin.15]
MYLPATAFLTSAALLAGQMVGLARPLLWQPPTPPTSSALFAATPAISTQSSKKTVRYNPPPAPR